MLQEDDYLQAWQLATVNRVDLNVIVDYAWPRFLQHSRKFVEAVGDDQAVCDLLSALRSDSVTAPGGLYASALPDPDTEPLNVRLVLQTAYSTCQIAFAFSVMPSCTAVDNPIFQLDEQNLLPAQKALLFSLEVRHQNIIWCRVRQHRRCFRLGRRWQLCAK